MRNCVKAATSIDLYAPFKVAVEEDGDTMSPISAEINEDFPFTFIDRDRQDLNTSLLPQRENQIARALS